MTQIQNTIDHISVDDLNFDPENPRLPDSLRNATVDESEIVTWMLTDASLIELFESISQQGFFGGEPILGYKDADNNIFVVEGNRRLAAIKLFSDPGLATKKKRQVEAVISEALVSAPKNLPIIIYENRSDILKYLGFRHITGIKSWSALAKARYLSQLQGDLGDLDFRGQCIRLAKEIGSNSNYVARLLTSLKLYKVIEENDFFDIDSLNEQSINFSLLTTALSYTNIANFVGLTSSKDIEASDLSIETLKELTEWVYKTSDSGKTKLGESRNLKTLSAVVENQDALQVFRDGESLEIARLHTNEPDEIFQQSLSDAKKFLALALQQVPHISSASSTDIDKILDMVETLRAIHGITKTKTKKESDDTFDLG